MLKTFYFKNVASKFYEFYTLTDRTDRKYWQTGLTDRIDRQDWKTRLTDWTYKQDWQTELTDMTDKQGWQTGMTDRLAGQTLDRQDRQDWHARRTDRQDWQTGSTDRTDRQAGQTGLTDRQDGQQTGQPKFNEELLRVRKTTSARGKVQSKSDIFLPLADLQCFIEYNGRIYWKSLLCITATEQSFRLKIRILEDSWSMYFPLYLLSL